MPRSAFVYCADVAILWTTYSQSTEVSLAKLARLSAPSDGSGNDGTRVGRGAGGPALAAHLSSEPWTNVLDLGARSRHGSDGTHRDRGVTTEVFRPLSLRRCRARRSRGR